MRRAIWRAVARKFGNGVRIGSGVGFKHLETFEIGDGVFIGDQSYIQGRFDGVTKIGNHVWIGPQSYLDARHLILEDHVGWGPGRKVLGSVHTGMPIDRPIMETDLEIRSVHVQAWADIGTGAVLLPGVTAAKVVSLGPGPWLPAMFLRLPLSLVCRPSLSAGEKEYESKTKPALIRKSRRELQTSTGHRRRGIDRLPHCRMDWLPRVSTRSWCSTI